MRTETEVAAEVLVAAWAHLSKRGRIGRDKETLLELGAAVGLAPEQMKRAYYRVIDEHVPQRRHRECSPSDPVGEIRADDPAEAALAADVDDVGLKSIRYINNGNQTVLMMGVVRQRDEGLCTLCDEPIYRLSPKGPLTTKCLMCRLK